MINYDPLFEEEDFEYNPIIELGFAFQKSRILLTACELDIFSILDNDSKTSLEIAEAIPANQSSLERLLNALVSLNMLHKEDNKYYNSKISARFLVSNSKDYIGTARHANYLWKSWSNLTESVKTGLPPKDLKWDSDRIDSFVETTELRAYNLAPMVVKSLNLENVNTVLDLGGGSGYYSAEMLKANPHLRITILEFPEVIPYTKKYMSKHIGIERFKFIGADFFESELEKGYDMVFLGNIINFFKLWDNVKLFTKVYKILNYSGFVAVFDKILNDDRISPINSSLMNLNMLLNSNGGSCYTATEIWIMLKEAFFDNIKRIDIQKGSSLFIGYK
jgi:hypothetical protein